MTNSIGRLVIRASGEVGIEGGGLLAVVYPVADCRASKAEHDTNARRIVACVNALQHVSTEQLETGEMLSLTQRMVDAERQRDALLAALQAYENAHDMLFAQCCSNPITNAWGKQVDVTLLNEAHCLAGPAIAAAKGGAQ